jgi:hypothetical protein
MKLKLTNFRLDHGYAQARIDVYPDTWDKTYAQHYVPCLDKDEKPTGLYQLNPCLCHFLVINPSDSKEEAINLITSLFPLSDLAELDDLLQQPCANIRQVGLKMLPKVNPNPKKASLANLTSLKSILDNITLTNFNGGFIPSALDTAIDVGSGAVTRLGSVGSGYTKIDLNNPANATGLIDTVQFFYNLNATAVTCGFLYLVSGTTYHCRSTTGSLGDFLAGSTQTVTGLSLAISTDDIMGIHETAGNIKTTDAGGLGVRYVAGNKLVLNNETNYSSILAGYFESVYATGATVSSGIQKFTLLNEMGY